MRFSILICHLPERVEQLANLRASLDPWVTDQVEVLVDDGPGTTGTKRNRLLDRSAGEYVAFVDDDDLVAPEYCQLILEATNQGVDCVGIEGVLVEGGMNTWRFRHSITVGRWCKDKNARIYFRTPNHLNPVKREHAVATRFPDMTVGEDRDYSDRIRARLKTEFFIEHTIYYYNIYPRG